MEILNYDEPIEIAEGIYWVGFVDEEAGLHCNPYLIIEGNEAVLIDAGSRDDFSTVMMKILKTGIDPNQISRLIYQHYDPDLCGSIPHMENIIENSDLKILSHRENNIFIKYYSSRRPKECIETLGMTFTFKTGRQLRFIRTPFAHSTGSFMTYDTLTGTLFSSDIFGSYDRAWELFTTLSSHCGDCTPVDICRHDGNSCKVKGILDFHRRIMTSNKALRYAVEQVRAINPVAVAPQHGGVIRGREWISIVLDNLEAEPHIGIDGFLKEIGYE